MMMFTLKVLALGFLVMEQAQCARTVKRCTKKPPTEPTNKTSGSVVNSGHGCFPAVGFKMPEATPTSLTNWWCNADTEYAFVGFGYDISPCDFLLRSLFFFYMLTATSFFFSGPSLTLLKTHFSNMRKEFNARYVRLYENCDKEGF